MDKAPRIAVVSEYPLSPGNGPGFRVLLQQLKDFPLDRLSTVYLSDRRDRADSGLAREGLSHFEISSAGAGPARLVSVVFGFFASLGRTGDPETVYLLLPNSHADLVLAWLFTLFCRKTVVWWMDDFVERADFSPLKQAFGRWLRARVHCRSASRIVVSREMKARFESLFPGVPVTGVLGKRIENVIHRDAKQPGNPLRLAYVGSFDWPYIQPLQALRQAALGGRQFHLDLFGIQEPPESLLLQDRISYKGMIPEEEMSQLLSRYDYLVLPYSFDERTRTMMKHSFPSKLIDYLGSGTPVWAISPSDLPCIAELRDHDIGSTTLSLNQGELEQGLDRLQSVDVATYTRWSENATRWATDEFMYQPGQFLTLLVSGGRAAGQ